MAGTYVDMQNRIADELIGRTDLLPQIKLAILSAIQHHEVEEFWFYEGQQAATVLAATGGGFQGSIALPAGTISVESLQLTYSGRPRTLPCYDWNFFLDMGGTDPKIKGLPFAYANYEDALWFLPIPDQAYPLTLTGVFRPAAPVNDTDTSGWFTFGEELIRSRAKWDLFQNVLHDPENAALSKAAENDALSNLRGRSTSKVATGFVRPTRF